MMTNQMPDPAGPSRFAMVLLKNNYGIDLNNFSVNQVNDMLNLMSMAMYAHKEMQPFFQSKDAAIKGE